MTSDIATHYERLCGNYSGIPLLSDLRTQLMRLNTCLSVLDLDPTQKSIVDMGAGTGELGRLLQECHPGARYTVQSCFIWLNKWVFIHIWYILICADCKVQIFQIMIKACILFQLERWYVLNRPKVYLTQVMTKSFQFKKISRNSSNFNIWNIMLSYSFRY